MLSRMMPAKAATSLAVSRSINAPHQMGLAGAARNLGAIVGVVVVMTCLILAAIASK
jgi:hypothetical protein